MEQVELVKVHPCYHHGECINWLSEFLILFILNWRFKMREEHSWIKETIPVTKTVGLCSAAILSITAPLGTGSVLLPLIPILRPSESNMAGRGRGRGKGRGFTFDVSQLGFGRGEALPAAILQPPPLYPVCEFLFTHLFAERIYLLHTPVWGKLRSRRTLVVSPRS